MVWEKFIRKYFVGGPGLFGKSPAEGLAPSARGPLWAHSGAETKLTADVTAQRNGDPGEHDKSNRARAAPPPSSQREHDCVLSSKSRFSFFAPFFSCHSFSRTPDALDRRRDLPKAKKKGFRTRWRGHALDNLRHTSAFIYFIGTYYNGSHWYTEFRRGCC